MTTQEFSSRSDADTVIDRIVRALNSESMHAALQESLNRFYEGVRQNFERQVNSDGTQWPQRKEEGDGHPLLRDGGDLFAKAVGDDPGGQQIENNIATASISLGAIPYARIHNMGGDIANAFGLGITVHIPQREYFYANDETIKAITEIMSKKVAEIIADAIRKST